MKNCVPLFDKKGKEFTLLVVGLFTEEESVSVVDNAEMECGSAINGFVVNFSETLRFEELYTEVHAGYVNKRIEEQGF